MLVQKYANTISCGLPKKVYAQMMSNITIDVAIGLVPVIGDIADAVFKANVKNLIILEDYLKKVYAPKEQTQTPMRQVDDQGHPIGAIDGVDDGVRRPDRVASKKERQGGWLNNLNNMAGGGSRRDRERDAERGYAQQQQHHHQQQQQQYQQAPIRQERRERDDYQENGTVYQGRR